MRGGFRGRIDHYTLKRDRFQLPLDMRYSRPDDQRRVLMQLTSTQTYQPSTTPDETNRDPEAKTPRAKYQTHAPRSDKGLAAPRASRGWNTQN